MQMDNYTFLESLIQGLLQAINAKGWKGCLHDEILP